MGLLRWCPQRLTLAGNPLAATELPPSGARGEPLAPRSCHRCPCDARAAKPGSFPHFPLQHIRGPQTREKTIDLRQITTLFWGSCFRD